MAVIGCMIAIGLYERKCATEIEQDHSLWKKLIPIPFAIHSGKGQTYVILINFCYI